MSSLQCMTNPARLSVYGFLTTRVSEQITYYLEVQSTNLDELPCVLVMLAEFLQTYHKYHIFQALTDQQLPTKRTSQHHVFAAFWPSSMLSPFVYYWLVNTGDASLHCSVISCYFLCLINAAQLLKSATIDLFSSSQHCVTIIFSIPSVESNPCVHLKKNHMDN